jgi:hypothetical protein
MAPDYKKGRLLVMLQAFIDDSWDKDIFALGGYIAPIEVWDKFSVDWVSVCKEIPSIKYYKTNEALALKGCFEKWSLSVRDYKIDKLSGIIPKNNCYSIASYLSQKDLEEIGESIFPSPYNDPYFSCAACLIAWICVSNFPLFSQTAKIDFFFDEQGRVGREFRVFFDLLLRPLFPRLGMCFHVNDKDVPPLQVADMNVAWTRRHESSNIQRPTASDDNLSQIKRFDLKIDRKFFERFRFSIKNKSATKVFLRSIGLDNDNE